MAAGGGLLILGVVTIAVVPGPGGAAQRRAEPAAATAPRPPGSLPAGASTGPATRRAPSATEQEELCRDRLARLAQAIRAYRLAHDGRVPVTLSTLYYDGMIEDLADLQCPAAPAPLSSRTRIDAESEYTLAPLPGGPASIVRERSPRHAAATLLVAAADGTVRAVALPAGQPAWPAVTRPAP